MNEFIAIVGILYTSSHTYREANNQSLSNNLKGKQCKIGSEVIRKWPYRQQIHINLLSSSKDNTYAHIPQITYKNG